MKASQNRNVEVTRRPKMEPASVLHDQARVRVLASGKPSLRDLCSTFGGWNVPEVSGKVKQ